MLSCKDVGRLISESLDRDIPWYGRLMLRLHLFICGACARYEKQIHFMKENLSRKVAQEKELNEDPPQKLPEDARARMKQALLAAKDED
mgnify:CR=1 FL=1